MIGEWGEGRGGREGGGVDELLSPVKEDESRPNSQAEKNLCRVEKVIVLALKTGILDLLYG